MQKKTEHNINERLQRVLQIHFDPNEGTPYWLERQEQWGMDVLQNVRTIDDLPTLGPMDETALAERPIEDFIPRRFHSRQDIILAQTGGSLGRPKFAVHRLDEFDTAFVTPFVRAAQACGFPRDTHWLFVGPTGPHVIGRAAQACARAYGKGDIFTVDFDPRWAKKLVPGSFAATRYLDHILDQALHILETQSIEVLFSTPIVLARLWDLLSKEQCGCIRGIHLGGMAVDSDFMKKLRNAFPKAVILSGLGNTLLGMAPQLDYHEDTGMDYYPYGDRLVSRIVADGPSRPDLQQTVPYGQRGRLVWHRLDEMQLLINLVERDTAIRIVPCNIEGFTCEGIRDPRPVVNETVKPSIGLY